MGITRRGNMMLQLLAVWCLKGRITKRCYRAAEPRKCVCYVHFDVPLEGLALRRGQFIDVREKSGCVLDLSWETCR